MATSGTVYSAYAKQSCVYVSWSIIKTDIPNNQDLLYWEAGVIVGGGNLWYSNAVRIDSIYIDGGSSLGSGTYSNFTANGTYPKLSGEKWIPHTEGKKSISVSINGWFYGYGTKSGNDTFDLPDIPRQAILTSAPDFTDLDNPTIYYSNPAGNAVSQLFAGIGYKGELVVGYRDDISKTGTTYTFTLTDAERKALRELTPNSKTTTVTFYVTTVINGSYEGSTLDKTLTIVENDDTKPSLTMSVGLNNDTLPSQFSGLYIQGKSKVTASLSASGKYNATISGYSTEVDGKAYAGNNITSDTLINNGTLTVKGTATDTRGFKKTLTKDITVLPYSKPYVAPIGDTILCYRANQNGTKNSNSTSVWLRARRRYSPIIANGVQKNFGLMQYRFKLVSEAWGSQAWRPLLAKANTSTDDYNALLDGVTFGTKNSYNIQVGVVDDIGEVSNLIDLTIPTDDVPLHLGKGGTVVAVGKYCDYSKPHTFQVGWDGRFEANGDLGGNIYAEKSVSAKTVNATTELLLKGVSIIDVIYPVGSIYMSVNSTSPSTLFGGTWERIKDKFLLASGDSYANGTTGGKPEHTLTPEELPTHGHTVPMHTTDQEASGYGLSISGSFADRVLVTGGNPMWSGDAGLGKAHNNMPPYLAVYVWKRKS